MTEEEKNAIQELRKTLKRKKFDAEKEQKTEEKQEQQKDLNDQKIAELTETLQRLQAEFDNYRKRVDKENKEFIKFANAEFIKNLLPLLDTFDIALKHTQDHEKFVKGMELVHKQLFNMLEKEGLKKIEAMGKKFDAHLHEVLLKEKSDKDEDVVLEELQKGYLLNGKVLRHSKVKISSKE